MKDSTTFINLVNEVLVLRLNGKADKDIGFLDKLFEKYKNKKDKYEIRIKYLKRMYSVARTLNSDLDNKDWEQLFNKTNLKNLHKNFFL